MERKEYGIDTIIKNEKLRCQELKTQLEKELLDYPRGSLVVRDYNGRKYCYLRYRDGEKVVTKYAGTYKKYDELSALINEREQLVAKIKQLSLEIEKIEKMEAIK